MNTQPFVSYEDALDIVFEHRNRAYGAYQLRRQYPATLARALGFALVIIALLLLLPHVMKAVSSLMPVAEILDEEYVITEVNLTPPPPKPPIPATPPPVTRSVQRFVPPVVENDDKVLDEPPKLTNDDLLKDPSDIGKVTVDVPVDAAPTLDDPGLALVESPPPPKEDKVLEIFDVHKPPSFPGGEAELMRYLAKNTQYPDLAKEANIQGTVVLTFVVDKNGDITDVAILRDLQGGCGKEAMRVVKNMPRWSPGEANGHNVRVRFTLPVKFKLN